MANADDEFGSFLLNREYLHQQIADNIQDIIVSSRLQPGAKLPSERDLARRLGVSRPTVSEAIRLLEQRGLVQLKVGSGTYVTDKVRSVFVQSMERLFVLRSVSHTDLMTFREMLEPEVAAQAAQGATPEDLTTLKDLVDQLEAAFDADDLESLAVADSGFHEALGLATHNELVIAVVCGLQNVMRACIKLQHYTPRGGNPQGNRTHRPIFDAIVARDPDAARRAMLEHLRLTRLTLDVPGDEALPAARSIAVPLGGS